MAHKENDEALLELAFRIERWLKRNRYWLIGAAVVIVVVLAASVADSYVESQRRIAANGALLTLQTDPANAEAQAILQAKSPELYDLYQLGVAAQNGDTALLTQLAQKRTIVGDLASYQLASLGNQASNFTQFAMRETKILKDFAALEEAFLLLQQNDFVAARALLAGIELSSELKNIATALEHYGAGKK